MQIGQEVEGSFSLPCYHYWLCQKDPIALDRKPEANRAAFDFRLIPVMFRKKPTVDG